MAKKILSEADIKEKEFLAKCKLFFSTLTGRAIQYAYINIIPNILLLTNSTSSGPDIEHGDRLMNYSVGELCLHVVRIKDTSFLYELLHYLDIPETEPCCLKMSAVLSWLNKYKRRDLEAGWVNDQIILRPKRTETWNARHVVGFTIRNFHIIKALHDLYKYVSQIGTDQHQRQYPHLTQKFPTDVALVGRVFFLPIETKWYHKDEKPLFEGYQPHVEILGLDGMTCVSLREFIKKLPEKSYTLDWYSWVVDDSAIFSMVVFENEMMEVKSIRPYTPTIPLQLGTVFQIELT